VEHNVRQTGVKDDPDTADLLILGGTVVTMDTQRQVFENGAVAIVGGAIAAIGPEAEISNRFLADETIRAHPHDIVLPGLINAHNHAPMTMLRGVADDIALMDWLEDYIFPAESQLVNPEFVRIGTRLAALEMIRSGTTTFADMYYFEDDVAGVVSETGLRGVLGETILDNPTPDSATPDDALAYTEAFLRKWANHPRITPGIAPHAPYTVGPETLRKVVKLARQYNAPMLIHLAETSDEVETIRSRYGTTPVGYLESVGVLGPDLLAAHAVWVNESDIVTLATHNVGLVHNPESNMKLTSGAMPIAQLRQAGIAIGLGTDGPASNNDLDMFGAMLTGALLHKFVDNDPTTMPATEVVSLATIEGARALHMNDAIGSLEVGKRADIIIVDGSRPNLVPRYDLYSHLTYAARGHDVKTTIVEGQILYHDETFTTLDPESVFSDARKLANRVRQVLRDR
jgi:5-methylthioadenosine/S-adenosylhomocysteine deaminase